MKTAFIFFSLLSSMLFAQDSWPMQGGNPQHTGYTNRSFGVITPTENWSLTANSASPATPINSLFACTGAGKVFTTVKHDYKSYLISARSLNTGKIIWEKHFPTPTGSGYYAAPSYSDGKIYFQHTDNTENSQLYCLNASNGKILWDQSFLTQWSQFHPPTISNGVVYVPEGRYGGVAAYNKNTGEKLFFASSLPQGHIWTPSIEGQFFYSWIKGKLSKHNLTTGVIENSLTTSTSFNAGTLAIHNGKGFGINNSTLYAINLSTMQVEWSLLGVKDGTIPSVNTQDVFVYTTDGTTILKLNQVSGTEQGSFSCAGASYGNQPILSQDKLFTAFGNTAQIFDIQSEEELQTISTDISSQAISVSENYLILSGHEGLSVYSLNLSTPAKNHAPHAPDKYYEIVSDQVLALPALPNVGLNEGMYDPDNDSMLTFSLNTSSTNGTAQVNPDGSFDYTPAANFSGYDRFTYTVSDGEHTSREATISIKVKATTEPHIKVELFKDGSPLAPGQETSGTITGKVTITNAMMNHAQFYKNFRPLKPLESGSMVDTMTWERTFEIDSSEFYDGENLISVHAHPHNHHGMPYQTDFLLGTFKFVALNDNPSPSGDWKLPEARIKPNTINVTTTGPSGAAVLNDSGLHNPKISNEFLIFDDAGSLHFEQDDRIRGNTQVIAHLGASVMGRFRWTGRTPQHAEFQIVSSVNLINHQAPMERNANLMFFISDPDGRANYAQQAITIPAATAELRNQYPIPSLNAHFLDITQGDSLIVLENDTKMIKVKVTGARHPLAPTYKRLNFWIGNSLVTSIDLSSQFASLAKNQDTFEISIPLEGSLINQILTDRSGTGRDSTAFAIWMDFSNNPGRQNLPTSEHVHLSSIRTIEMSWPYGPPLLHVVSPATNDTVYHNPIVQTAIYGSGTNGMKAAIQLPSGEVIIDSDNNGQIILPLQPVGQQDLLLYLVDAQNNRVLNESANKSLSLTILNSAPSARDDRFWTGVDSPLNVNASNGLLHNDRDLDGGVLTCSILAQPQFGNLTLSSDGSFIYTPSPAFTGIDHFTYLASDGEDQRPARVEITVNNTPHRTQRIPSWGTYAGNKEHSSSTFDHINIGQPAQLWSLPISGSFPIIENDQLYLQTRGGEASISAIDLTSGDFNWTNSNILNRFAYGNPAVYNEKLYVQGDGQLYSLSTVSGEVQWMAPFTAQATDYSPPIIAENTVFSNGGRFGGLYSFNTSLGSENFFIPALQVNNPSSPAYKDGIVYTYSKNSLLKIDAQSGQLLESVDLFAGYTPSLTKSSAVIEGDFIILYVASSSTHIRLTTLNRHTLETIWQSSPIDCSINESYRLASPSVKEGKIYVNAISSIKVFNLLNGIEETSFDCPEGVSRRAPITTGNLLIISSITKTFIYELATRELLYTLPTGTELALYGDKLITSGENQTTCYLLDTVFDVTALTNGSSNGSITFEKSTVNYGEPVTASILAAEGYYISKVVVNGEEIALSGLMTSGEYTHPDTSSDLEIDAEFARIQPHLYSSLVHGVTTEWQTVTLPREYVMPVITSSIVTSSGRAPVVVRLRNITGHSFDIRVQRADNSSDDPGAYDISYLVANVGKFTNVEHGITMDAFTFTTDRVAHKSNWVGQRQFLSQALTSPTVFSGVQTFNDTQWCSSFAYGPNSSSAPSSTNCHIGLHVGEDPNRSRLPEIVGYIAIESGTWTLSDFTFTAGLSADSIFGLGNNSNDSISVTEKGFVQVAQAGVDGHDGGWAVLLNSPQSNQGTIQVAIDEDTYGDSERWHTSEQVAYLSSRYTGAPKIHTSSIQAVSNEWQTVEIPHQYRSMVVTATPVYGSTQEPRVIRIRNAKGNSFEIRAQSATGTDNTLEPIVVTYVVAEEGVYTHAKHGVTMEATKVLSTLTDENSSWVGESQTITNIYTSPVVFGQVMTYNDAKWSTFWSSGSDRWNPISPGALKVGKHVAEDITVTRLDETLGYIVFESGDYQIESGENITIGMGADTIRGISDTGTYYNLDALNAVLAQNAMDGSDGGWAVLRGNAASSNGQIAISIDEDTIGDSDRNHTTEQVGYLIVKP